MLFAIIGFEGFSQGSCSYQFVDNGGVSDNYLPNSDNTYTLCPSNPNENVTVTFTSFNTEVQYDAMFVYDGSVVNPVFQIFSTNASGQYPITQPGAFWGTDIPGPFTSSAPDGCLTFVFISDSSVQRSGWIADVLCVPNRGFQLFSFLDINANGIKDANEPNFPDSTFTITSNNTGIATNVIPTTAFMYLRKTILQTIIQLVATSILHIVTITLLQQVFQMLILVRTTDFFPLDSLLQIQ